MKKLDQIDEELKQKSYFLNERVKEQRCLLGIAKLSSCADLPLPAVFEQIISFMIPAWQFPDRAYARILFRHIDTRSSNYTETAVRIRQPLLVNGTEDGCIEIGYLDVLQEETGDHFLEEERRLLEGIAEIVEGIIEKKRQERLIRRASRRLREKSLELERKNLALREILGQIEQEKNEIKDQLGMTVRKFILPLVQNLKNPNLTPGERDAYIQLIESNIMNINSSLSRKLTDRKLNLSPREAEICNMIKNGLQTKEISEMLKLSVLTVERHRFNIRKKLELNNTQVNLQTFLQEP